MRSHITALVAMICLSVLTGCGVTFADRVINQPLSTDMLGRSVVKDTEILKRHLEEIPGYIVVDGGNGDLEPVVPVLIDYTPPVTAITGEEAFYHSIIDRTAGAQGSYLQLITASLDIKYKAEVTITETAEAFIPKANVPWVKIAQWATDHPPVQGQKRYYVQGALLSTVSSTVYGEVSANANVDGGAAFGAGGKVYATDKTTQTTNRAYIGVHILDVDKVRDNPPRDVRILSERDNPYAVRGRIFNSLAPPKP
jgi:hypothetical protein